MFRPNLKGPIPLDLTGLKFGDWTVLEYAGYCKNNHFILWLCQCVCGSRYKVATAELKLGRSTRCKECGVKAGGQKNRLRPFEALYRVLLANAKNRKIPVTLSYEEFKSFSNRRECVYCKAKLNWAEHFIRKDFRGSNLDRIDCSLGYTKENCVVCCWRCNSVKGKFLSYEQMKEVGLLFQKWEGRLG